MICSAFASATVANVGPGFDVLGFSLEGHGDTVEVRKVSGEPGIVISLITGDQEKLPRDPKLNTVGVAIHEVLRHRGLLDSFRIEIDLHKGLPLGSGMGSSAASAVAAIVAIEGLFEDDLPALVLLEIAKECEKVACGSPHGDNVAPALFGGLVLLRPETAEGYLHLPVPENLWCGVIHPDIEIRTEDARSALPQSISLSDATYNTAEIAALVSGLYESNYKRIGRALQDRLATPYRCLLIPGYAEAMEAVEASSALGGGISGSGPTLFVLAEGKRNCEDGIAAISRVFKSHGRSATSHCSRIAQEGASLLLYT